MIKKFLISIIILSFTSLKAEIVKEVVIEGNKRVSDETIKVYGEIEINLGKKYALTLKFCITILRYGCSQKCFTEILFLTRFHKKFSRLFLF